MSRMALDWNSIRPLNGGRDKGFEELCAQLARAKTPSGSTFVRKGTPDAGVERYAILSDGAVRGWRSKYVDGRGYASRPSFRLRFYPFTEGHIDHDRPTPRRSRSVPVRGCPSTGPRRRATSATPSRSCVSGAERFERPYDSRELANLRERMVMSSGKIWIRHISRLVSFLSRQSTGALVGQPILTCFACTS